MPPPKKAAGIVRKFDAPVAVHDTEMPSTHSETVVEPLAVEPVALAPLAVDEAEYPAPIAAPAIPAGAVPLAVEPVAVEPVPATPVAAEAITAETIAELPEDAHKIATAGLSIVAENIQNTKTEIKTTMDKAIKTAEDLVTFGQGNLEAMMKSSQIWMTGLQDLSKTFAATAQAHMEETVSTMKTFAGLRSIKDAVDLQTSFARTTFEKALNETGKMTESSIRLAEQALAPITARVTFAVEKFGRAV